MFGESAHNASQPMPATAIVIDVRNFTPNLKASRLDETGVEQFCRFLAEFHALCIDAALSAMPFSLQDVHQGYRTKNPLFKPPP